MRTHRAFETDATQNDRNIRVSAHDRLIKCSAGYGAIARTGISNVSLLVRRTFLPPTDYVEAKLNNCGQSKSAPNWHYLHPPSCRKREYDHGRDPGHHSAHAA